MVDSLDDTPDWHTSMAALLAAVAATPQIVPPLQLEPGSTVNEHFRIERELGVGGMGVVYLAEDTRLHRKIALKLHARLTHEIGVQRMMREAAAMAQLNHPNVLTVHEVGTIDDHVFIAMEFVDGHTLREWMREKPRTWAEIRPVMLAAGEGLAAAHAAGLVHRDFKPENVLISTTGRVSVADFGLARTAEDGAEATAGAAHAASDAPVSSLTRTGVIMGTPAYMAPEQCDSAQVDARADQFAFCVTMYEALYGRRPFVGKALVELLDEIARGNIRPPAEHTDVPRWLHDAVARGLSAAPSERYEDMPELLAELRKDPARARRTRAIITGSVVALLAVVAVVFFAARSSVHTTKEDPCDGGQKQVDSIWNDARSKRVQTSLNNQAPNLENWPSIRRRMGGYATTWAAIHRNACEATKVQRTQPATMMKKRFACLDRALVAFDGLLTTFETADLAGAGRALESAYLLPALEQCNDLDVLKRGVLPVTDPKADRQVSILRRAMFNARVLMMNGHTKRALTLIKEIAEDANRIRGGDLVAEALTLRGQVLSMMGRHKEAERDLRKAYTASRRVKDSASAGLAAALMITVAAGKGNWTLADQWADLAQIELPHAGYRSSAADEIQRRISELRASEGKHAQALGHLRAALRVEKHLYGDKHLRLADTHIRLAGALDALGKRKEAKAHVAKALALAKQLAGEHHPVLAKALQALTLIHNGAGEHKQAVATADRALSLTRKAYGETHPSVGYAWQNRGVALHGLGKMDDAITSYQRALEVLRKHLRPRHGDLGILYSNLGLSYEHKQQLTKSLEYHTRALEVLESQYGKNHYDVATARTNLGVTLTEKRQFARAATYFEQAIKIFDAVATNDPAIIVPLNSLGVCLTELGRPAIAVPLLERALALGDKTKAQPSRRARTRLNLAAAMWWSKKDRRGAIKLMKDARSIYATLGASHKHLLAHSERWLDKRKPGWRNDMKPHQPRRKKPAVEP